MNRRIYKRLSYEDVIYLHSIVEKYGAAKGCNVGLLKACLDYPFIDAYGYKPYRGIFAKAAALLYAIISFHPFADGN